MKSSLKYIWLIGFVCSAFFGVHEYSIQYPDFFPEPQYKFAQNPLSIDGIQLGRALFYDPILSRDSSISCASCHSPYNAFAHTDHDLSHGIDDQIGHRNAPALFNLAWQKSFMWDGAINHLDMQALAPISHPKEMDESLENVVHKLQASPIYPALFYAAFEDSLISGSRVLKALSQFQLTLVSAGSKYDKVTQGAAVFSPQEQNGYALFKRHCNSCHQEPLFSSYDFAHNGLSLDSSLNDWGKAAISEKKSDQGLFKIPSLRNLKYSPPYMHDGRFRTLRQVLEHYTEGIIEHENLSKELSAPIVLSPNEKVDLIAFLLSLTDQDFVFDKENKFPREILLPGTGFKK